MGRMKKGRSAFRLLKNAHLLRFPHPSSLRRTFKYVSFLRISGALHLGIFEQPVKNDFYRKLLVLIGGRRDATEDQGVDREARVGWP